MTDNHWILSLPFLGRVKLDTVVAVRCSTVRRMAPALLALAFAWLGLVRTARAAPPAATAPLPPISGAPTNVSAPVADSDPVAPPASSSPPPSAPPASASPPPSTPPASPSAATGSAVAPAASPPATPSTSASAPALLDDTAFNSTPIEPRHSDWYGGTLLIADGISTSLALGGIAANDYKVTFPVGAAFMISDGFIVHSQNGQWGRAVLSLFMRGGAAFGGCALFPGCFAKDKPSTAGTAGFIGGALLAAGLDIAFLAHKPIHSFRRRIESNALPLVLRATPLQRGASLGVGMDF